MFGKLVPCGGGSVMPLLKPKLIVGRKPECDVVIACSSVSGRHCELEMVDGVWWVRDLQSKNGTSVNGTKVERHKIAPNNLLTLGRQRFMVEYQPQKKPVAPSARDAEDDLALEFLMNDPDAKSAPMLPVVEDFGKSSPVLKIVAPAVPPPPPLVDLGKLIPCGGGAPIPLRAPQLILGRSPECDVRIRFPSVSSRHCKLSFEDGYWMVEDLNSSNGTWVDGDRCDLDCLMPDSILALDKHRYTIQYTPAGDNPPVVKKRFKQSLLEKAGLVNKLSDQHLGGQELPEDDFDRPKRYNLLDDDE